MNDSAVTPEEIIAAVNAAKIRATYGAIGEALGITPQNVRLVLSKRRKEASWIVNADTGLPTGYGPSELDPDLRSKPHIIRTKTELLTLVRAYKHAVRD